jgi:uncharacterized RmlC-like cupin family protein
MTEPRRNHHECKSSHSNAGRGQASHTGRSAASVPSNRSGLEAQLHVRIDNAGRALHRSSHTSRSGRNLLPAGWECEWQVGDQLVHATPGAFLFIPPGVPHNIGNASDKPARMFLTVSPPGHEHYFEQLAKLTSRGGPPDAKVIDELRSRYDTIQLSALKTN